MNMHDSIDDFFSYTQEDELMNDAQSIKTKGICTKQLNKQNLTHAHQLIAKVKIKIAKNITIPKIWETIEIDTPGDLNNII